MKTSKLLLALMAAAGLAVAGAGQAATSAQPGTMSKDAHDAAFKSAAAQYKIDNEACKSMTGNAKDVCIEQAKGKEKVAKAEADAAKGNEDNWHRFLEKWTKERASSDKSRG